MPPGRCINPPVEASIARGGGIPGKSPRALLSCGGLRLLRLSSLWVPFLRDFSRRVSREGGGVRDKERAKSRGVSRLLGGASWGGEGGKGDLRGEMAPFFCRWFFDRLREFERERDRDCLRRRSFSRWRFGGGLELSLRRSRRFFEARRFRFGGGLTLALALGEDFFREERFFFFFLAGGGGGDGEGISPSSGDALGWRSTIQTRQTTMWANALE